MRSNPRHAPGHDATGGTGDGGFHCDEMVAEMPEDLAVDPRYEPPILILTAPAPPPRQPDP